MLEQNAPDRRKIRSRLTPRLHPVYNPDMLYRVLAVICLSAVSLTAQTVERPVRAVTDPGVVTTRQSITPAGVPSIFEGRVYGVAFGASSSELWVLTASQVYRINWRENQVIERHPLGGSPGLQGIRYDSAAERVLASATDGDGQVRLLSVGGGALKALSEHLGRFIAGSLAVAPAKVAAVPLIYDNKLAVIDLETGAARTIATGIAPFGVALNSAATVAYVTNWGGRLPAPKDLTAPTGLKKDADQVVVDARGIAATGTVTRIDLTKSVATGTIPVGLHPTALVWDEAHGRLYVANGNKDSVSVIDTTENRLRRTIELQPFTRKVFGIAPTALALSPDGSTLYVACGGINAIAVVDAETGHIDGLIPTAWYPNALAVAAGGKRIAVGTLFGIGSGWKDAPERRYVHSYRGSVNVIATPDAAQLASYTTAVGENNHLAVGPPQPAPEVSPDTRPVAIPSRSGEPSLIKYVVYIVKENRTYDQVFGDMAKGNSDPSLVMFGKNVTPNHHRLADQFVLLDNFYATGGNSADGHQWLTQANETDYCLWPGYRGRSYPYDGTDPIAYSHGGFIWDAALARGKSVRVYGEFIPRMQGLGPDQRIGLLNRWKAGEDFTSRWHVRADVTSLSKVMAKNYPTFTNAIPDVIRAQIFLADVKKWEEKDQMPNLVILQLPCDHTYGTQPGTSTPKAMVADNDYALGLMVEALTKTKFWKQMAIFIVEDDAQNGVDHVDGHRTVAMVASPYARRGAIDSTFYSNQSILKTIEEILGLPTLSLFDLIANDMRASFQNTPDYGGYAAVRPVQSLFELNPQPEALEGAAKQAALDSMKMRWDVPDAAPTERLNRILWGRIRGWDTPYPEPHHAVFAPMSIEVDDDDRDEVR